MATTAFPLSGRAVRDLLAQVEPDDLGQFDREFRISLDAAGRSFDVSGVEATIRRWGRLAVSRAHPLTSDEQTLLAAARAGNDDGLYEQRDDRSFHQL